jgi:hypothetical protein
LHRTRRDGEIAGREIKHRDNPWLLSRSSCPMVSAGAGGVHA